MTHPRPKLLALSVLSAALLAACGGGSTSAPAPGASIRATRGTVASSGGGILVVNGVEISTAGAAIRVDDHPAGADDLLPGAVVTVRGDIRGRRGEAEHVELEHAVRGKVRSVSGGIVDVGGVQVHVDPSTFGAAAAGERVKVSGVPDDKGGLRASRVDGEPGQAEDLEVKGFVSALDLAGRTFELRLSPDAASFLVVDWAGIALPAGLANGSYVEVRSAAPASGSPATILASSIELEDAFGREREIEVELEGILTSLPVAVAGGLELVLDGVTVRAQGSTRWENGQQADLVPGVKLEAEGRLDAGGVLHAEKISFRDVVRITAPVDAVAADRLTVLGIEVLLGEFVDFDVNLGGSIVPGDVVQVRGYPAPGGAVVALRVDDRSGEERVTLQGVASSKDAADPARPSFVVQGVQVLTLASSELRGLDGAPLSASAFFAAVEPGRTVIRARTRSKPGPEEVIVNPPASILVATHLEIEGND